MKRFKNYFFPTFITILLSVVVFYVLKELLPDRLFAEVTTKNDTNIIVDSLMLETLADTTIIENIPTEETAIIEESAPVASGGLVRFFEKLHQLQQAKKGTVRIAYFGDSMTEGDLIVQDIRKNFQEKYGGHGVGFVPISLLVPPQGITIKHNYSNEWITYSFLKKSPESMGVSGYVSFSTDSTNCWTRYKAGSCPLVNPKLFYGKSSNDSAYINITTDKDSLKTIHLKPQSLLNTLSTASGVKNLKLAFLKADSIPFYGVDFSDKNGVHVDNFSSRGNSGLPLSTFNVLLMNAFQRELHYDLIILQYGTNVISSNTTNYGWYAKRMTNTVNHIKRCFPEADILVISLADKATKYGTEMKTDSTIAPLIEAQKIYARNTESGFINLFELMGGEGSMVEWVNAKPSLAAKDYTHFSSRGSKKIADLIFKEIEEEYDNFKAQYNFTDSDTEEQDENAEDE